MAFVGDHDTSSSSTPRYSNRVFLSFRGVDTRLTFTGHLYTALTNAGINTFKDDVEITRGEKIKSELERGIQQSSASLIVFSEDYASSRWCLEELAMIIERRKVSRDLVLPLFYHVNPTDIRQQTGSIGEAFAKYEEKVNTKANTEKERLVEDIKRWRAALKEAADISGMELKREANGDESKFIRQVVDVVQGRLSPKLLDVGPHLVNMPARTRDINLWIRDAKADASIMLIYGMGGIGKTTIAKIVYNENYRDFDGCSFLSDVRERSKAHKSLVDLQKQLLSDICGRKNEEVHSVDEGIYKIRDAICFKKVILVLDDVDHADQLKAIFKMQDHLFPASKVIVTTRNEQLKHSYPHCKLHEVRTLSNYESVELFSLHAFRQGHPNESYREQVQKIISHCDGLPLALEVLGSSLYEKNLDIWESLLKKLDVNPHSHIVEKLMTSFDCLQDDDVKNVFLHIACFFSGEDKNCTVEILDACEMSAVHSIDHLVDRCLLKIDYDNKLRMHQLVKDMGRYVVHKESPDDPGERSRLWRSQDCFNVLREKTGTRRVKALAFDIQTYRECNNAESIIWGTNPKKRKIEEPYGWTNSLKRHTSKIFSWNLRGNKARNSNDTTLVADAFGRMQKLMFLKLNNIELSGCYTDFPKGLRWLSWHTCHLKYIPSDLSLQSLVCLEMQYSSLKQLWKGSKFLPALKILNLSHSMSLATCPDFSGIPNLERLILEGCTQLLEVCESIRSAKGLVLLNLKDCKRLRKLPRNISMLLFLEELMISGCSSLNEFPVGLTNLESLKWFHANEIDMSALLSRAKGISSWASFPQFIQVLSLENCQLSNDCFPKDFSNLSLLKKLNLSGNLITSLPDCCVTLSKLEKLCVDSCPLLQSVVGLPVALKLLLRGGSMGSHRKHDILVWDTWDYISCGDCPMLAEIEGCYKILPIRNVTRRTIKNLGLMELESSLKESDLFHDVKVKHEFGILTTFVRMDKLPRCFIIFENTREKICFNVPNNPNKIQGLTLGFVFDETDCHNYHSLSLNIVNKTRGPEWSYTFDDRDAGDKGLGWLLYAKLGKSLLLQPRDELIISLCSLPGLLQFGVMVVYSDDHNKKEEDIGDGNKLTTQQYNLKAQFSSSRLYSFGRQLNLYGDDCCRSGAFVVYRSNPHL